jgi:hypothetical protein
MFAFLGLESPLHWLILLMIGLAMIGVPTLVVVLVLKLAGNSGRTPNESDKAELRAENEHLRAEVERLKKGSQD